jgi:hypothetical protein
MVLFIISVYLLYKCKAPTQRAYLASAVVMFTLGTADIILTHYYLFGHMLKGQDAVLRLKHIYAKLIIYSANK